MALSRAQQDREGPCEGSGLRVENAEAIDTQSHSRTTMAPATATAYAFSGCIMPAMASSGQGFEGLNAQLLVDSIPALIHTARPDGYLDYFNKPWLEYFGATLDKVAGWNWTAFVHPEDVEGIVAKWRACLATGEIFEYETRVRRADGEYRWMFHRKVPLREANGNIVKWYGSSLDIEERKTAEEQLRLLTQELRRREAYLTEAQRLSHTGSFGWRPDTGEIVWSDETYRIFEYDPAEKPTLNMVLQRIHSQDRALEQQLIEDVSKSGADFEQEYRLLLPDGRVKHVHAIAHAVQNASGDREFVGAVTDITERKTTEGKIRRLVDAGILGIFIANLEGEIVEANQAFLQMFQYDRQDLVSGRLHWADMTPAELHERDQRAITEALATGFFQPYEKQFFRKDGSRLPVLLGGALFPDSNEGVSFVLDLSEQKRAEVALRRSEAYLAEAQRLSHTGSWAWSPNTDVRHWSEECYRVLGFDPRDGVPRMEELIQRIHPDDQPAFRESAERAMHSKLDEEVDYRIVHPDGTVRDVHSIGHPVFSPRGNLIEYTGTVVDVTERKRAEDELRRSEMKLKNAFDEIKKSEADLLEAQGLGHTGSWRHEVLTGIVTISPEVHRIFGIRPGEDASIAGFFFGRIHSEDRPIEAQRYERANSAKTDFESDYRIVLPDGSIKHVHNVGHPVLNESGDIREFVGTVIDVTERKRAEDTIREQETELRQILDLAPQHVAVYGPNRERLYANRIKLDYLGFSLEEWQQSPGRGKYFHPDDTRLIDGFFDRTVARASADELELRLRKSDGSYRWFLARLNPLRDDKGQITRWYVVYTDIEDRKRAEERLRQENVALREEIDKASMFEEIVGTSPALKAVLSRISKVAPSDSTVLITGETGTGKELVARAIHRRSGRAPRAFVSVNCAAIPRDLIASELFGHERGAFTGATQQRLGRFELASGGTLFLDEVGELPPETQIALLRVLQEHEFERVGGTRRIRADVRVIAATNRDLQAAISAGSFRRDLFYRLNVFPIEIPPLRERKEDIRLLVEYFIDRYARKAGKNITSVDKQTLRLLESYPWPGNIRELQNVIERSVIVSETASFSVDESWLSQQRLERNAESELHLSEKVAAQEKEIIEAALRECEGRVFGPKGAAAKLGIPRSTLESKIRTLKINKNRFKASAG
jgi:PAS domain S-box-containing protein